MKWRKAAARAVLFVHTTVGSTRVIQSTATKCASIALSAVFDLYHTSHIVAGLGAATGCRTQSLQLAIMDRRVCCWFTYYFVQMIYYLHRLATQFSTAPSQLHHHQPSPTAKQTKHTNRTHTHTHAHRQTQINDTHCDTAVEYKNYNC